VSGPYVGPRPLPERRPSLWVRWLCRGLGWLAVVSNGWDESREGK